MRLFLWDTDGSLKGQERLLSLGGELIPYPFSRLFVEEENFTAAEESAPQPPFLSFLGSEDYHFLTYFHLRKLRQPFRLILIDHHLDNQKSDLPLLSCGNWMNWAMELPNLVEAVIFGPEEFERRSDRISVFPDPDPGKIKPGEAGIYISIDKDILGQEELELGWEQGNWKASELIHFVSQLRSASPGIIAADVCGEPILNPSNFSFFRETQLERSEEINLKIASIFLNFAH